MEDYKEEYELGSIVTAKRTYNGEIITGEFGGFHLLDKSNPKSIVGVVHTSNGSYDVKPNSIKSVISEDERIKKAVIEFVKQNKSFTHCKGVSKDDCLAWLEKQGRRKYLDYPYVTGWRENRTDNKPKIKHSILMLTTHGVAEGEWLGEEWCQYRWSCKVKDKDVLYWLHLSDLETLEKENVKQGEQKPTDKVEPKFEVGDWVVNNNGEPRVFRVEEKGWPDSIISGSLGNQYINTFTLNKQYHLWTIQDAKDGDVLTTDTWTFIFKKYQDKFVCYHCAASAFSNFSISDTGEFDSNYVHPATKEQRDFLFSKMKKDGYEWSDKDRKLIKIVK